jgi:radical SAM superfamily enzyme YgiQ (UPF0313 family)
MTADSDRKDVIVLARIETDTVIHPLGLIYLGGALRKAGYQKVKVFNIFKDEIDKTVDEIVKMKPLFVGLSTLTGPQTRYTYDMSRAIKARDKDIKIIWGGVHPTMLPEDCLKEDCVDMVCIGEGEEVITELAASLAAKADLEGIRGIGYKREEKAVINPRRPFITELDRFEPDWGLVDDFG